MNNEEAGDPVAKDPEGDAEKKPLIRKWIPEPFARTDAMHGAEPLAKKRSGTIIIGDAGDITGRSTSGPEARTRKARKE